MQSKKYKGRKKYSKSEALQNIENCKAMIDVCQECIRNYEKEKLEKVDNLIIALCGISKEEIIQENLARIGYEKSKLEYMKQFIN